MMGVGAEWWGEQEGGERAPSAEEQQQQGDNHDLGLATTTED